MNSVKLMQVFRRKFSNFILKPLLISLLFSSVFASSGNALQETPSLNWTTPAVSAPHVVQKKFYSKSAKSDVSFHVYIPEAYSAEQARHFPVIYWLHGHGGGIIGIPRLAGYFDAAMREGKIPPSLIVFPNGMAESMWCNSKDGTVPMETVLIDELVPYIDATFRTIPSRSGRLIEGFSMGGYGAARLGLAYPHIFGAISMLGAGPMQLEFDAAHGPPNMAADRKRVLRNVYGDDQDYFKALSPWTIAERNVKAAVRCESRIQIAVGDRDAMKYANRNFAEHLKNLHINHDFYLIPDVAHDVMQLYQKLGEDHFSFYRQALGVGSSGGASGECAEN